MDVCSEVKAAKLLQRPFLHNVSLTQEKITFKVPDNSIRANEWYSALAIQCRRLRGDRVYVVRGDSNIERLKIPSPSPSLMMRHEIRRRIRQCDWPSGQYRGLVRTA